MTTSSLQRPIGFKPSEISALINEEVVEQHAEEAAFQWTSRDRAVLAPHYSLNDLAGLDERVEANLDGLQVAGQIGWELCEKALGLEAPGEVFAAGVLAFESGDKGRIQKVLDTGSTTLELQRPLISALGWPSFDQVENVIRDLLLSEHPGIRRVGIGAYAIHRRDPGPALLQALSDMDTPLRARALKAAGELGRVDLLPAILQSISEPDDNCRFFAVWSAARLGERTAPVVAVLQKITETPGQYAEQALGMALRCMELPQAKAWRQRLRGNSQQLRLAAIGAGVIGDPDVVGDLIALVEIETVARVAGEAFSMITGVDLSYEDLDKDAPEGPQGGPTEEPEDEDVALDPDENLPWPAPELVKNWWEKNRGKFRSGIRYLCGKEIGTESLKDVLAKGNQRQRAAAALELAVREPKQPLFEVRAPGKRQLKILKT